MSFLPEHSPVATLPPRPRLRRMPGEERRLIESIRVVLAIIAGLLMLDIPDPLRERLLPAVIGFSVYAGGVLWLSARRARIPWLRSLHWLDAGCFLLLIGLAGKAGMHYFLFLFFPVMFAAWQSSVSESISVAAFSSLSALTLFALQAPETSLAILLALPLSLLITSSLIAVLARNELHARRGLDLAAQLVEQIDPRRGLEAILPTLLEQLARAFSASGALLLIKDADQQQRVLCWEPDEGCSLLSAQATCALSATLASLPPALAFAWRSKPHWFSPAYLESFSLDGEAAAVPDRDTIARLAGLLGQPSLMSAPFSCRNSSSMRLLLVGSHQHLQTRALDNLAHTTEQIGPSLDNASLLERLATEAVDSERSRIGRDLHDSAIQPYIGLKYAIEGLLREAGPDNPLTPDLQRLAELAREELASMRNVVSGLRNAHSTGGTLLASAVQRQAARFGQLFGVRVQVEIDGELPVSRQLAGELFHLVAEGLANIRRHTRAEEAWIRLACEGDSPRLLRLCIGNAHGAGESPRHFTPRSLSERAATLGGSARVETDCAGSCVQICIPLPATNGVSQ